MVENNTDKEASESIVAEKQKANAKFNSLSTTFNFLAGVMLAAGMAIIGTALKGVTSFAAAATAISGAPIGIAFLVTAAVLTSVAVYSTYKASRNFTSANSDSLEINAQHTAKYLVKEIEAKNKCLTENSGRADGKTWCQVAAERKAAQQQAQSL